MKKICKRMIIVIILLISLMICNTEFVKAQVKAKDLYVNDNVELKATNIGIGGGGALFFPAISPHDSKDMLVVPDMGGIYITHNHGDSWNRKYLNGVVYAATYDPNRKGVLYAGGTGLYRSTDNGDSFELIFPKEEDIIDKLTMDEGSIKYLFTHSKVYDPYQFVKSILIDPEDSNHIFILSYRDWGEKNGIVYESTDNGENFHRLFEYVTKNRSEIYWGVNELAYKRETKEIFVVNDEGIIGYNLKEKKKYTYYIPEEMLVDVETVYENNKTHFIVIEKTSELDNSYTKVYYTNDFINKKDITKVFTDVNPTTFNDKWEGFGKVTFKYNFRFVVATSLNNIYITNSSQPETTEHGVYWTITGIIRYHDNEAKYLYGIPFKPQNNLKSRLWDDNNTEAYGIALSKQNEDEFLFTHILGVNYAKDNDNIYPKYSTCIEGTFPDCKYTTNGIDEQTTYGVRRDPFHENVLLLLNTDLGLIRSENNGKSWIRTNDGIPSKWKNTVYDLIFDERRENVVYSIWSSRHDAPYYPGNETDGVYGGFAISRDGGKTWDADYSSGIPESAIPVKMSIIYTVDNGPAVIIVATFNQGFFISYDAGKTFVEMNEGLERTSYKDEDAYRYILASDIEVVNGRIFGITARDWYQNTTHSGGVFEYVDGSWVKLDTPKNLTIPRDIYGNGDRLFISSTTTSIYDFKNGNDFNNYGGGVYVYEDRKFMQIFDESVSTTGVQIDSKGTMFVSDLDGNIYRKELNKEWQKIYENYHNRSKGIQLYEDDDALYYASFGGGLLKLEGLSKLYDNGSDEEIKGDINKNGKVDLTDVLIELKIYFKNIEPNEYQKNVGDMNCDDKIDLTDILMLLKVYFRSN